MTGGSCDKADAEERQYQHEAGGDLQILQFL